MRPADLQADRNLRGSPHADVARATAGVASPTGEDLPPDQIIQMFRDYVASLPDDRFPRTKGAVVETYASSPTLSR